MQLLRAGSNLPTYAAGPDGGVGVDVEGRVIRGAVAAEIGDFKTGRGTFDLESLRLIVNLINSAPDGVLVNYGHQGDVGSSQSLDAFLGRAKNARVDGNKVRVDVYLNPVAFLAGDSSLGQRVMLRAKLDPESLAMSLVVASQKIPSGNRSPLWRPQAIQSLDVVLIGDAVNGGMLCAALSANRPAKAFHTASILRFDPVRRTEPASVLVIRR